MSKILRIVVQDGTEVTDIVEYVGLEKVNAVRAALVELATNKPLSDRSQNLNMWREVHNDSRRIRATIKRQDKAAGRSLQKVDKYFNAMMRSAGWEA